LLRTIAALRPVGEPRRLPCDAKNQPSGSHTNARAIGVALIKCIGGGRSIHREPPFLSERISLSTAVRRGDEEDSHLGDFIEDKNAILPIDAAIQSNLRETTTRVLVSVTPREERVLRMRFGMNKDHTLEEVGRQFSVTRDTVKSRSFRSGLTLAGQ
jgi:DNA-directed RNA polymerase specialized sigma24 family protein